MSISPHQLANDLQARWRDIETSFHAAYWESQIKADPKTEARRVELELELRRLKGDPDSYEAVKAALEEEVHDPVLGRQLQVLQLSLTGNQMDESRRKQIVELASSIESDFAAYRPQVDGRTLTDNEIEEILKTSDDENLRRQAWEASKEVGRVVAKRIRELARLRNQVALDLGYADYYRMSLDLQELSEEWLFERMEELERLTDAPFAAWKATVDGRLADRFGKDTLYPWHYADVFFQELPPDGRVSLDHLFTEPVAPELARETFARWDIDLSRVLEKSDLFPRELKSQHAFCLDVDRTGDDVRVLANVVPGERWVEVMLHECGHAAYDICIDDELPYLLRRSAHTFVTESIAILSGRLARDPQWLTGVAGLPGTEIDELASGLHAANSAHSLLFARWGLVMVHFERDLYADPEADLDARWWELVERFQLVTPPPRMAPDWASKIHIAAAPVYYHNYLLGEMLASQLRSTIEREYGGLIGVPEAGEFLKRRIFRSGALLRWDSLIEEATGRALSAEDFAHHVLVEG